MKEHIISFIIKNCKTLKEKPFDDFTAAEKELEKIRKQHPKNKYILLCKVQ